MEEQKGNKHENHEILNLLGYGLAKFNDAFVKKGNAYIHRKYLIDSLFGNENHKIQEFFVDGYDFKIDIMKTNLYIEFNVETE